MTERSESNSRMALKESINLFLKNIFVTSTANDAAPNYVRCPKLRVPVGSPEQYYYATRSSASFLYFKWAIWKGSEVIFNVSLACLTRSASPGALRDGPNSGSLTTMPVGTFISQQSIALR